MSEKAVYASLILNVISIAQDASDSQRRFESKYATIRLTLILSSKITCVPGWLRCQQSIACSSSDTCLFLYATSLLRNARPPLSFTRLVRVRSSAVLIRTVLLWSTVIGAVGSASGKDSRTSINRVIL